MSATCRNAHHRIHAKGVLRVSCYSQNAVVCPRFRQGRVLDALHTTVCGNRLGYLRANGDGRHVYCRNSASGGGLLPAGRKQVRIEIPGILLEVESKDILQGQGVIEDILGYQNVTGIVVRETAELGTGELYSAVLALKDAIGSKRMVLVEDRSDVAEAVGADGVMVSASGLPIVVAKNAMGSGALVGKVAQSGEDATKAAFEGAGLLVMEGSNDMYNLVVEARKQTSGSSVPVMSKLNQSLIEDIDANQASALLSEVDGVVVRLEDYRAWNTIYEERGGVDFGTMLKSCLSAEDTRSPSVEESNDSMGKVAQVSDVLSISRESMVAEQKEFLTGLIDFLRAECPLLEEVSLLEDSVKQLDELFLVVIVGEFNSGKSAVVNAMLGGEIVPEGILPTTNEITVIKWADVRNGEEERVEQQSDGLFVRYTGADLLKEINIVDTPGTNVILERQQRLTEEFIPRADLVLFVLSADRPFTDSEVRFLKYVREWGKKVVFVVNKVDLLANNDEVNEVVEFVENNAKRLLSVQGAKAIPVSAKRATEAKVECRYAMGDEGSGVLTPVEQEYLSGSQKWKSSRFENLESHVRDFLLGTGGTPESMRLKLQTPLFVAEALMDAAQKQLQSELDVLRQDAESIKLVQSQLNTFRDDMTKEAKLQRAEISQQVSRMMDMIGGVIDQVMQLSNWQSLLPYLDKNSTTSAAVQVLYTQDISTDAVQRINAIVDEHSSWLDVNCKRVEQNYRDFVMERAGAYNVPPPPIASSSSRREWRETQEQRIQDSQYPTKEEEEEDFNIDMTRFGTMLETEIRTAVTSSVSTAGSAAGLGLVLTYILPNTLEDLLAVGLSAAVGYTSLLNIPVRRMEAKKKISADIDTLVQKLFKDMEAERMEALDQCESSVKDMVAPLETVVTGEISRLERNMHTLNSDYASQLERLKQKII